MSTWSESNPPPACRRGHRFGPDLVVVSFRHCLCDRASGGGHISWQCRTCDDVQYSDGHDDDGRFPSANPAPRWA